MVNLNCSIIKMNTVSKQKTHTCNYCGKTHTRKGSHNRHIILCEIIYSNKREKKCYEEETSDIPSHLQLYRIVQELALKNAVLEEKMSEMQSWLDKKKKKIDVVQWLTTNKSENIVSFTEWYNKLSVNSDHIELLIEENAVKTMCEIIDENIKRVQNIPIACFQQKTNLFYIFQKDDSGVEVWKRAKSEELVLFIRSIHKNLWRELTYWRDKNDEKIKNNEKMEQLYIKTILKLSGFNFDHDSAAMCKLRSHLYTQIKTDLKNVIEYEFEF